MSLKILGLTAVLSFGASVVHAGPVLDQIKARHQVNCGVVIDQDDFSKEDTHGNLAVLGADLCKAVTAAALDAGAKVVISAYQDEPTGLNALKSGKIDLLSAATPSLQNRSHYLAGFGPTVFYDGQGFLVPTASPIKTLKDLDGKLICYLGETEAEQILPTALHARHVNYIPFPFEEMGEMEAALVSGRCAAITGDVTQLANMRAAFLGQRNNYSILPEMITNDPVAPAYPAADREWGAIVDWTLEVLIQAEDSGVTAANVDAMRSSDDPVIRRLLGTARGPVLALGLDQEWSLRAIKATGNFAEIYDRDVGAHSPLKLTRGPTALSKDGGLLYPMPIR